MYVNRYETFKNLPHQRNIDVIVAGMIEGKGVKALVKQLY
ncbi:hypothetical protein ACUXCC_001020 [Cytobacillus horneckiae]